MIKNDRIKIEYYKDSIVEYGFYGGKLFWKINFNKEFKHGYFYPWTATGESIHEFHWNGNYLI